MPPRLNTCSPWAVIEDLPEDAVELDPERAELLLQMASNILFEFTGRRWPGQCTETLRPYSCGCSCSSRNLCTCPEPPQIDLPLRPVIAITQVRVDGQVVPDRLYRLDSARWLVFQRDNLEDGDLVTGWPSWQRLDRDPTEEDTFEIVLTRGQLPPDGGELATAALAGELAKLFFPPPSGSTCRLPRRVQTISRQGVTIALLDPLTLFDDGKTGLPEVDLWVAGCNAVKSNRTASVFRAGPPPRRQDRFRRG